MFITARIFFYYHPRLWHSQLSKALVKAALQNYLETRGEEGWEGHLLPHRNCGQWTFFKFLKHIVSLSSTYSLNYNLPTYYLLELQAEIRTLLTACELQHIRMWTIKNYKTKQDKNLNNPPTHARKERNKSRENNRNKLSSASFFFQF